MKYSVKIALLAGGLLPLSVLGCEPSSSARPANVSGYQGTLPPPPPQAPALPVLPGLPLPAGWAWPFDLRNVLSVFSPISVVRPIDVSRLAPYQGTGPCAPVQVASGVWFAPDCGMMRMAESSAVALKGITAPSVLPLMVDLRSSGLDGPVKYQQMVGVCWSFAISTVMDNALRRAGRQEVIAPLHVLSSGMWNELWQKGKSERNITVEPNWPYDPVKACKLNESKSEIWCEQAYHVQHGSWRDDPILVAELESAKRSGVFHVTRVERLKTGDADQMAAVLAQGQAIYVGFEYNQKAWGSIGNATAEIPDYVQEEGGHAVVAVGYRYVGATRQFLLHNSWGSEWRDHGYAWISEAMVRAHAKDMITLELNAGGSGSLPPPIQPIPTPTTNGMPPWPFPFPATVGTSSDCPAGQTRDVILGNCAAACAGGSPSVAGICPSSAAGGAPSGACPTGQVVDWLTRTCAPQCKNGLPSVGGQCMP